MKLTDIQERISALPEEVLARPEKLFPVILEFYEDARIDDTSLEEDGDMLLFQWGSYDWGQGPSFELDLTRQAIPAGTEDPPILQLQCTYRYEPAYFQNVVPGNQWCYSPHELAEFRSFVLGSEAMRRAAGLTPASMDILLEDAE